MASGAGAILSPTRIYVPLIKALQDRGIVPGRNRISSCERRRRTQSNHLIHVLCGFGGGTLASTEKCITDDNTIYV